MMTIPSWERSHIPYQPAPFKMIFLFPRWDMWSFPGEYIIIIIRTHDASMYGIFTYIYIACNIKIYHSCRFIYKKIPYMDASWMMKNHTKKLQSEAQSFLQSIEARTFQCLLFDMSKSCYQLTKNKNWSWKGVIFASWFSEISEHTLIYKIPQPLKAFRWEGR